MAPLQQDSEWSLDPRYTYYCSGGYTYSNGVCRRSNWYWYGRWILTGVIIILFIIFLALCMRRSRQRRLQGGGARPMYGTGWMGKWGGGAGGYNAQQQNPQAYQQPPPQYSQQPVGAQYTGTTYNSNQGYYGHNTGTYATAPGGDIPLQQPPNAYAYPTRSAPADDYAPPEGPPPTKH